MEQDKRAAATLRLLKIMDELREKCPWDRKQTFATLRDNTIEETYELADALLEGNMEGIREELGDLMLHIVFYSKLGAEAGAFDYTDVVNGLCDKLIYRHPHVYGDIHADTPDEVKRNWEALKLRKKNRRSGTLGGVPAGLPGDGQGAAHRREGGPEQGSTGSGARMSGPKSARRSARSRPRCGAATRRPWKGSSATSSSRSSTPAGSTASTPRRRSNAPTASSSAASPRWRKPLPVRGRMLADLTLDEQETLWQQAKKGEN